MGMRRLTCWRPDWLPSVVLLLLALVRPAPAQQLHITNYHSSNGLPQDQVLAIQQDRTGFIWIGSYGGLTRFDGAAFRTYSRADGLLANTVTSIVEDAAGRLVVGMNGGVCVRLAERFRCVGREAGPFGQSAVRLAPDALGGVWVASDAGLVHLDSAGSVRAIPLPAGGPATALAVDRSGVVWVATATVLARLNGDSLVPVSMPELHGETVRVLRAGQRGLLIVTAKDVIEFADGHARELFALPQDSAAAITDVLVTPDSTLWVSTRRGVLVCRDGQTERLTRDNGLDGDDINTLAGDREGNVWFGTESGLARSTPGPFRHLTEREGLPSPFVRALAEDGRGQLWAGTRNGIAVLIGGRFHELPVLRGVRVYAFAMLPGSGMLIATGNGLVHYDNGLRHRYGVQDGLPDAFVRSLLVDPAGGVWVGTRGGIVRWESGRIVAVADTLLARANVMTMSRDARGRLWVGMNVGGVLIYDGARTRKLGAADGLSDETVWALAHDSAGRMWVGTNGDGAYRVSPAGVIERFGVKQGLLNPFVWQVLIDRRGRAWFYTSQGIDRLTNASMQHLGKGDGLLDLEGSASASLEDHEGTLWFGTGAGVTRYRFAEDRGTKASPIPQVMIEGLATGTHLIPLDRARIPSGAGPLRINYTSPMFRNAGGLRFRYQLVGEGNWSEPTAERSITIAGLSPGKHTFEVEALDEDGRASLLPARVTVTVLPAFWQALWFRLLVLLALGSAVAAVPMLRARRIEAERARLEREVSARTEQLTSQAHRLEREVTEREEAQANLRRSEERLRDIVEHSTNLFYSHTPDHVLTYVSPQSQLLLGMSPEETMRRFNEIRTEHPDNAIGRAATKRAIDTGEKQPPYELELRHASGDPVWVLVNEAPIVRDGRTVALVGSLTNITAEKLARAREVELAEKLRQAQKMEAVGRLAGGIAHEFNNLLTVMVGNADILVAELQPGSEEQKDVAEILKAAGRASSLVAQLMAFSRQQLVTRGILDLNVVILESARMLQQVIGADVRLAVAPDDEPAWVLADQGQLSQVLINLTANARDAMPAGGEVVIAITHERRSAPLAADVPPGPFVVLRVSDQGAGMDAATVSKLFEPFFTTKGVGQGTGLGLAMVHGIVKQNGGHVEVESAPGHGTTFRIYLPASEPPVAKPAPIVDDQPQFARTDEQVILVVDDEDGVRSVICRGLRQKGYRVLEAPDGLTAVALAERFRGQIHLLLSDVVMPGMQGKQVAEQILAARPATKILFMTGHSQGMLGTRGLLGDATRVMHKPFRQTELIRRVQELLAP